MPKSNRDSNKKNIKKMKEIKKKKEIKKTKEIKTTKNKKSTKEDSNNNEQKNTTKSKYKIKIGKTVGYQKKGDDSVKYGTIVALDPLIVQLQDSKQNVSETILAKHNIELIFDPKKKKIKNDVDEKSAKLEKASEANKSKKAKHTQIEAKDNIYIESEDNLFIPVNNGWFTLENIIPSYSDQIFKKNVSIVRRLAKNDSRFNPNHAKASRMSRKLMAQEYQSKIKADVIKLYKNELDSAISNAAAPHHVKYDEELPELNKISNRRDSTSLDQFRLMQNFSLYRYHRNHYTEFEEKTLDKYRYRPIPKSLKYQDPTLNPYKEQYDNLEYPNGQTRKSNRNTKKNPKDKATDNPKEKSKDKSKSKPKEKPKDKVKEKSKKN